MNAIGIDVLKGICTVAVIQPFGEVVRMPFDVVHTTKELNELADFIRSLDDESRVVMESTGRYSEPIANALCEAGAFVCAVNSKLIQDYCSNTSCRDKNDDPDVNMLFSSPARESDGHEKGVDFIALFWYCDSVSSLSKKAFAYAVGRSLAPQLIAKIGDINCFPKWTSLLRFSRIEPLENQSGIYSQHSRRSSKQGSQHLRRALFQVMCCVL